MVLVIAAWAGRYSQKVVGTRNKPLSELADLAPCRVLISSVSKSSEFAWHGKEISMILNKIQLPKSTDKRTASKPWQLVFLLSVSLSYSFSVSEKGQAINVKRAVLQVIGLVSSLRRLKTPSAAIYWITPSHKNLLMSGSQWYAIAAIEIMQ